MVMSVRRLFTQFDLRRKANHTHIFKVHRLTAALGLLLLGSAHYVTLQAVAEALDAVTTLTAKRQLVTAEAQPVLDEVMLLCRRHATPSVNRGS